MSPENIPQQIVETKQRFRKQADLQAAFASLTEALREEVAEVRRLQDSGTSPVPILDYGDLQQERISPEQCDLVRRRGCVVVRNVFAREQANAWNELLVDYIERNGYYEQEKQKRGLDQYFSQLKSDRPQIFGLYWSQSQMQARQSEELARTRRWLNRLWDFQAEGTEQVFDPDRECTYADRVRRRQPGDSTLGLSPHMDAGSVERWLDSGYQQVYASVLAGQWEDYAPFRAAHRTEVEEIPSPAVCHMFRTYQGWTALTTQGPGDGTLQLVPISLSMPWMLLRALQDDIPEDELCGAQPGRALSANETYHSLLLEALTPIPRVEPGDTVWWHPDIVHAVEDQHSGAGYSNVMYIGAAPHCEKNVAFQQLQKEAFLAGKSSPDFAPEDYEVNFEGRATVSDLSPLGRKQMGFDSW